jgi:hypothetical protein
MCVQYILWTKQRNQKGLGKLLDRFIPSQFVPIGRQAEVVKSDDIKLRAEKYGKRKRSSAATLIIILG